MAQITLNSSGVASNGALALQSNGTTTAVTVDASQNVGVGRSPNYQLDVYRSGTTNTTVASANDNVVNILQVSGNTAGVIGTITSHPLLFTAGNTERMRVLTTGNILSLSGGSTTATGTGISFPATQSASSDANTLDDYEEGSWTPSALTGTNLTGISWSAGNYTRVGRLVTLIGYANCTVTSSNTLTYLTMNGAPFSTSIATSGSAFLNNNVKSGTAQIASNIAYAFFPAASAPVAGAEIIQFSITYTVA